MVYAYLESWIESLWYVRNVCAHYGRLYNINFTKKPRLYRDDIAIGLSNDRMMGTLLCLKRLLPDDDRWSEFLAELNQLLSKYPHVRIDKMGFPGNWKEILGTSYTN